MRDIRHNVKTQRHLSDEDGQDRAVRQNANEITNKEIESDLYGAMQTSPSVCPDKLQETIRLCITEMRLVSSKHEERTGFWTYLSDIFRFEGLSIFGLQIMALLISCIGISTATQIPETVTAFMPLFGLAFVPVLYRSQAHGMCEMEAATRASGAQIVLAKLILAGGANLLCMTAVFCLSISVSGASDQIAQMILYVTVPFLLYVAALLRGLRTCRHRGWVGSVTLSFAFCAGWGLSARIFPWLYETAATGVWMVGFVVCTVFLIREIIFILQTRREGKMYGIIS